MSHITYLKAIWDRIMSACAEAGHRILLAAEAHHLEGHIEGGGKPGSLAVPEGPERIFDMETFFQQDQTSAKDPYRFKEISSHNCKLKWPHNVDREKYPRQGCYQIQGSRFLIGHNYVFAPYVPFARFGMGDAADLRVTDLWTGERQVLNKGQLSEYEVRVPKDKSPGGGVRAIKIERTG
jgi:hypothetical protein